MILEKSEELTYFQFSSFKQFPITQAIYTRKGGHSTGPWHSLNVGNTVGDDSQNVKLNLGKILSEISYQERQLAQVKQVHSSTVRIINKTNSPESELIEADAMVTNNSGILLFMRFADCVPIFLFDPENNAIGIGHAGWKGTVSKVSLELVRAMENEYGSLAKNIFAGIGPSIGPDHYQVGSEVAQHIKISFPNQWQEMIYEDPDGVKLDLWKANKITLENAGVENIEVSEICTVCNLEDWFSHRGDCGKTGRFAAVIGLKNIK